MRRSFFKIVNEGIAQQSDKQQPLYLYGHKDNRNTLSLIVSSCDKNCWIKEDLADWQKVEVRCSLASDGKSKIYSFKDHSRLKRLKVPFSIEDNVQLTEYNKPTIAMDRFRAEQGALKNFPQIDGIVFTRLPFDIEAQRQLVLEEKKQSIHKDLQYLESIKNYQQQSIETAGKLSSELSSEVRKLSMLIGFVIEKCERVIQQLNEQSDSLESSAAESASAMAKMKI